MASTFDAAMLIRSSQRRADLTNLEAEDFEVGFPEESSSSGMVLVRVIAHGTPNDGAAGGETGRIYTHMGARITSTHPWDNTYDPADTIEFASAQPGGWFHVGAIVPVLPTGGAIARSICQRFFGLVTKTAHMGDIAAGIPRGLVEVEPADGNTGFVYWDPTKLVSFPGSRLQRAMTFPGTEIQVGEPVLVSYVGGPDDAQWIATNMPNLFGDPTSAEWANRPPAQDSMCTVADEDLPATPPPANEPLDTLSQVGSTGGGA